jgi:hypothetical protein
MSRPRSTQKVKKTKRSFSSLKGWGGPLIIFLSALVALGPVLVTGTSLGGDIGFHLISWIDAQHSMAQGILYPHWAESPSFGAGEPRFVFYPPLSWMCGAILGTFLPWSVVPLAFFIVLLAATGLAIRALARTVMPDGPATLAGCTALFLGYALFGVYRRNDFAEMLGGFWIPLLLLFALRRRVSAGKLWERTFDGSAAPLALVVAGAWLSNVPVGIMACYLLAFVALVSAAIEKSWLPVVRAAICTAAGMGLAALYLVPAVWERSWVSIRNALEPRNFQVENSWLFAHHADPYLGPHDIMLEQVSTVAVVMLSIAFVGWAVAWRRGAFSAERRLWLPLVLIPPVILLLLLPISLPIWNYLPGLRLLQFPWRWLLVLEAPMSIGFALAVWGNRKTLRMPVLAVCAAVFLAVCLLAHVLWFVPCRTVLSSIEESWREGVGVPGKPEYAPPGIRQPVLELLVGKNDEPLLDPAGFVFNDALAEAHAQVKPVACLLNSATEAGGQAQPGSAPSWRGDAASCNSAGWHEVMLSSDASGPTASAHAPEKRWIDGVADHPGYLILWLRDFPAWDVAVNGVRVNAVAERERGLLAIPVPQGNVLVSARWKTTDDVVVGRLISGVALLLVAGLYWLERKQLRRTA